MRWLNGRSIHRKKSTKKQSTWKPSSTLYLISSCCSFLECSNSKTGTKKGWSFFTCSVQSRGSTAVAAMKVYESERRPQRKPTRKQSQRSSLSFKGVLFLSPGCGSDKGA